MSEPTLPVATTHEPLNGFAVGVGGHRAQPGGEDVTRILAAQDRLDGTVLARDLLLQLRRGPLEV
jgi:hypothetical protein